jgi:uncharacterized protein with PQ loop repeat
METFAWIGSILLGVCALPQSYKSIKDKETVGVSPAFLWAWILGEMFTFVYVIFEKYSVPLLLNYLLNIIFISVILYYFYFPKNLDKES